MMRSISSIATSGFDKATITGTSPDARVTDTSDWLFAVLPSDDAYRGATPTEWRSFFGNAVSSMTRKASSPPTR
jgi:hypothetical protein